MKKYESVTDYLDSLTEWKSEMLVLREICLESGMTETLKWSIPTYTVNKKNIVGIGAFKNHVALWFFQGVFLNDPYKKLINAQEGTTKGLLQWRFSTIDEINPIRINEYLQEAIQNEKDGKRITVNRKKELLLPIELESVLNKDAELEKRFNAFTSFKKREFAEYIGEAKREATRINRLNKSIPMIMNGIGLNDKYR